MTLFARPTILFKKPVICSFVWSVSHRFGWMMDSTNDSNQSSNQRAFFGSLDVLIRRIKDGTFGEILDDWRWIFTYSARYKGAIVFYTILGIVSTTLGLVSSVASKYMIDIITGYKTDKLWVLILITLISAGTSLIFGNLLNRISTKLSIDINNDIQADIFDKIIDAEWLSLNHYRNGVRFLQGGVDVWRYDVEIPKKYGVDICVGDTRGPSGIFRFLRTAPVMLVMSRFLIKKQREYGKKTREMSSQVMNFEVETFYNFDTIKSFGIMDHFSRKLREWQQRFKKISLEYNWFQIWTGIFMSIIGMIVQYSAFGYCLFLLWTRQITYGTMTLFLEQRGKLSSAFSNVVSIIPNFLNSSISAHRIRELVELPREQHIPESSLLKAKEDDGFQVQMQHVDFSYIQGKRVITDSDFLASPGEIVALVGPSGEGKTTMIRLILGLVHPDSGRVWLRASDGREIDMNADTRYLFAYVPQGNTILSGTIAENLRMVKEDATDEEIVDALKTACAWDFVSKLPDTINSSIGERGRGFSEGQAQRIAIARALLRDAPILLLDEATSALDVTTERQVLRNIIQQKPNKTCIVTTHRPTVLNMCQRVYRVMQTHVTELTEEEASRMAMDF